MTDSILNLRGQNAGGTNYDQMTADVDLSGRLTSTNTGENFGSILKYCSLILIAPIFVFFFAKILVLEWTLGFQSDNVTTNVISAVCAVIMLHFGLGAFIYKAYFETPGEEFTNRCLVSILNRSSNTLRNNFAAARPTSKQRNRCLESWYARTNRFLTSNKTLLRRKVTSYATY
jgi:hypothetical protein